MASDAGFVRHVCDQLAGVGDLSHRKMFGEYALYLGGRVVALVCDDRLFLKPTEAGRALLEAPVEGVPYPGARPHLVLDEHLDDRELLIEIFRTTAAALPPPTPRRGRGGTRSGSPRGGGTRSGSPRGGGPRGRGRSA